MCKHGQPAICPFLTILKGNTELCLYCLQHVQRTRGQNKDYLSICFLPVFNHWANRGVPSCCLSAVPLLLKSQVLPPSALCRAGLPAIPSTCSHHGKLLSPSTSTDSFAGYSSLAWHLPAFSIHFQWCISPSQSTSITDGGGVMRAHQDAGGEGVGCLEECAGRLSVSL